MSIPGLIYVAMGAMIARVLLDGARTRGYRTLDWLRLAFDILRITMLWPLVLFAERAGEWLKREPVTAVQVVEAMEPAAATWQFENAVAVQASGD